METLRHVLNRWPAKKLAVEAGYCATCAGMLGTPKGVEALCSLAGYRHLTEEQCRKSADEGCQLCEIIVLEGWKKGQGEETANQRWFYFLARKPDSGFESSITKFDQAWTSKLSQGHGDIMALGGAYDLPDIFRSHGGSWYGEISLVIMASRDNPAAAYFPYRPLHSNFLADDVIDPAAKWLSDCVQGRHSFLPESSILVTLQPVPSASGRQMLANVEAMDNIKRLLARIETTQLPQTLLDAVLATRRLGIRYLWIDALCIIQDSEEDKALEIDKMGGIYQNATVTIAAAWPQKVSEGFLEILEDFMPNKSCTMPVHLPGQSQTGHVTITALQTKELAREVHLQTRGWAFQEAVLSSRLLTFYDCQLQCQCRSYQQKFLNTGHLKRSDPSRSHFTSFRDYSQVMPSEEQSPPSLSVSDLEDLWRNMVEEFTLRSLTFPTDRLPAMQGIVHEIREHCGLPADVDSTYVAGTWMACVPALLLWRPLNSSQWGGHFSTKRLHKVIERSESVPSWSWACVDSPVEFLMPHSEGMHYRGFSVLRAPSLVQPAKGVKSEVTPLEVECEVLRRSLHEFTDDRSVEGYWQITMDLDAEELDPSDTEIHYVLLDRYIGRLGRSEDDPLFCFDVSGIVTCETAEGSFRPLGYFRRLVHQPAEEEYSFGEGRRIKLV